MWYVWFLWSIFLLLIWVAVYALLKDKMVRRKMLVVSLFTSLMGFTEPIFVPEYWNPPSLFDLARRTGFDFESLIFAFGVGGLAVVIYDWLFKVKYEQVNMDEKHMSRHKYHILMLLMAPVIFLALYFSTDMNPIYTTFIALMGGGFATWYCRPDLKKKMIVSAFIFTFIYFVYFLFIVFFHPNYVNLVWNLSAISGIKIVGVPLEELMFAFGLGFFWSSLYEHIKWNKFKTG